MSHLIDSDKRTVYPVNPAASEVMGIAAYGSVVDIPYPVDLAVIAVPAPKVPAVLRECVQKRINAAVIVSAGFSEADEEGSQLETEIANIARQGGISFVGPNSMGHVDTLSHISSSAWLKNISPGPVALISQSGYYGEQIIYKGMASGVGFNKFVSTGNETSLHIEDYLEYLAQDKDTRIITAYIEGLREGKRFFRLAKETTVRKPVVVIKSGGTEESARAARSHTGALAGSDAVYSAAFKQAGVIRVEDDDELCDLLVPLLNQPLPRNNRVAILTIGGGLGVAGAEACEKDGLTLAQLLPYTIEKLNAFLPPRWPHSNPVDTSGMSATNREFTYRSILALMEDENVDAILFQAPLILGSEGITAILHFHAKETREFQKMQRQKLSMLKQQAQECGKPLFIVTTVADAEAYAFLHEIGIPVYSSSRRAVRALRHLVWYRHYLDATGR